MKTESAAFQCLHTAQAIIAGHWLAHGNVGKLTPELLSKLLTRAIEHGE